MTWLLAAKDASTAIPAWVPIATPFIAAAAALIVLWVNGYRADRARRRALYAEALRPLNEYREYPYAVRRRRHDAPSEERARIQAALQEVQERITHHEDLLRLERGGHLYAPYRALVRRTRIVAGRTVNEQWSTPPITDDKQMNLGQPFDVSKIDPYKDAFLDAVDEDLKWWRLFRWSANEPPGEDGPVVHPSGDLPDQTTETRPQGTPSGAG